MTLCRSYISIIPLICALSFYKHICSAVVDSINSFKGSLWSSLQAHRMWVMKAEYSEITPTVGSSTVNLCSWSRWNNVKDWSKSLIRCVASPGTRKASSAHHSNVLALQNTLQVKVTVDSSFNARRKSCCSLWEPFCYSLVIIHTFQPIWSVSFQ